MSRKLISLAIFAVTAALLLVPASLHAQGGGLLAMPPGLLLAGDEAGLFTIKADGTAKTYILEDGAPNCWLRDGKWSPQGDQFIYTRICGGESPSDWHADNRTADVYLYTPSVNSEVELEPTNGQFQNYAGDWHPTGSQVLIYSNRDLDRYNLYSVTVSSGDSSQVTNYESDLARASWDPTGRYLLYNRYIVDFTTVQWEIRVMDTTNGQESFVAVGMTPNWSPDGKWISYVTSGDNFESADVFIMPSDCILNAERCNPERDAINLTYTPTVIEREPLWSLDQTQLFYLRDTNSDPSVETWDIFRQDIQTGTLENVTNTADTSERHSEWERIDTPVTPIETVLPVIARVNTAQGAANMRSGPSTTDDIAAVLNNSQIVFVQGQHEASDGVWYRIALPGDGTIGWLFHTLAAPVTGELLSVPVVTP